MNNQPMQTNTPHAICGAKTRAGHPCKSRPMLNGRCRMHGGKALKGIESPTFKTGKYSKYLPDRLAGRYETAKKDPNLLELRDDIALLETRLGEILDNLGDGDTRKLWSDLNKVWDELELAIMEKDTDKQRVFINQLRDIIKRGHSIYNSWAEAYGVAEQRRKTIETERRQLIQLQQTITAERALTMMGAIISIIQTHITDQAKLNAISHDIRELTIIEAG